MKKYILISSIIFILILLVACLYGAYLYGYSGGKTFGESQKNLLLRVRLQDAPAISLAQVLKSKDSNSIFIYGKVQSIFGKTITILNRENKKVVFKMQDDAKYFRAQDAVKLSDLKIGDDMSVGVSINDNYTLSGYQLNIFKR